MTIAHHCIGRLIIAAVVCKPFQRSFYSPLRPVDRHFSLRHELVRDVIESVSPVDGILLLMRAIKAYIFDRGIQIIIHFMLIDRCVEIAAILADKCAEF